MLWDICVSQPGIEVLSIPFQKTPGWGNYKECSIYFKRKKLSQLESPYLARLRNKIKDIRALQETKLTEGVEGIEKYVEDAEGDWLENWDDSEE